MLTRASGIFCRRMLLKANTISQEATMVRHIHLVSKIERIHRSPSLLDLHKNYKIIGIYSLRYASTNETANETSNETVNATPQTNPFDEIPDPPTPLQPLQEIENITKFHPNGEPTFESIGLGGYSPTGIVQTCMEYLHITYDIPWWTAIVIGTICVRSIILPIVIKSQKNMINFSNHMPIIQKLQFEVTEARQCGDHYESARAATELAQYMKKNQLNVIKNFIVPLIQAPVFLSFFLGLKQMANTPVESLKQGGFWWLQDLTVYDPYYIMPIVTCITMYATIELGADGTNLKAMGIMRYFMRALPFVILPFMLHFPGVILVYWGSTNFISLIQTGILKIPRVRKALDMPTAIQHAPVTTTNKGNFIKEFKQTWTNMKISKQLSDRERADAVQFNSAGKGPIVKTFKYDPTKQKQSTILTKNR